MLARILNLPNWIIAGAPKAGTSSLFQWLSDHPGVTAAHEKETCYFADPGSHTFRKAQNFRDNGLAGYARLFQHAPEDAAAVIEATPGYMYSETALRELPHLQSRPSFIFVLREPVAQLQSLYRYYRENWNWIPRSMSFRDFIDASDQGLPLFRNNELAQNAVANAHYERVLGRWRDACGDDRVHVLLFEDLIAEKLSFMRSIASRMGLDAAFYDTYSFPAENVSYAARSYLLQRLNIAVRGYVPRGRAYEGIRHLYRRFNTSPPQAGIDTDSDWLAALSQRFQPTLAALEATYGLNVDVWRRSHEARLTNRPVPEAMPTTIGGTHA